MPEWWEDDCGDIPMMGQAAAAPPTPEGPVLKARFEDVPPPAAADSAAEAAPAAAVSGKLPRVMVDADAFAALKELASRRGVTLTQAASDAIVAASKQK